MEGILDMTQEYLDGFIKEIEKLHKKNELSKTVGPDYYEPGMMEYLDKYEGLYDSKTKEFMIRFDVRGTRYEGRTELIEKIKEGDKLKVIRDRENEYNSNNFTFDTLKNQNVGHMPAELCNVIAPFYDSSELVFNEASVSYVEPLSKRNRHAKQATLFVELKGAINA